MNMLSTPLWAAASPSHPAGERPPSTIRKTNMILATSYPFLEVFWTILIFFGFVIWLWLLFTVIADLFRRHDASGWVKVLWIIVLVIFPFLGVFIYLIAEHKGITERTVKAQKASEEQAAQYVRSVAGQSDPASQIANAKKLLDNGSITQGEFDQIKQKALAT
jgi:Phospholipase_D-nuclease N-terminal